MSTQGGKPALALAGSVLMIDDNTQHAHAMRTLFERTGWTVTLSHDPWDGLRAYEHERTDIVLMDLEMPGLTGLRLLELMRDRDPDATILILTGHAEVAQAVEAMQLGAENFLTKPADPAHLLAAASRAMEKSALRRRQRLLFTTAQAFPDASSVLGTAPPIRAAAEQLATLADGDIPVLLTGETGTGKSWAARYLHEISPRAGKPFIEVNCAGLSATFLDSELFGHERGAFTDAKSQKLGLFELADGGTLFLDEIGDLSHELQPKLLRVLETQRFRRLGGTREIQVDVRLVAATHRDLTLAVADQTFREDLFYRLAVFPVHLPSLRERGADDIELLAYQLLRDARKRLGRGPSVFDANVLQRMVTYSWPGNIRELRNTIERCMIVAMRAESVALEHLPPQMQGVLHSARPLLDEEDMTLSSAERRHIESVLAHFGNHRTRAAQALGISRTTLYGKLGESPGG